MLFSARRQLDKASSMTDAREKSFSRDTRSCSCCASASARLTRLARAFISRGLSERWGAVPWVAVSDSSRSVCLCCDCEVWGRGILDVGLFKDMSPGLRAMELSCGPGEGRSGVTLRFASCLPVNRPLMLFRTILLLERGKLLPLVVRDAARLARTSVGDCTAAFDGACAGRA